NADAEDDRAATGTDAGGPAEPSDGGPTGPAPEHGDIGPDAASGLELPGDDADAAAVGNGLSSGTPVPAIGEWRTGGGSDGNGSGRRESGLAPGGGSGSAGTAEQSAARASGSSLVFTVHAVGAADRRYRARTRAAGWRTRATAIVPAAAEAADATSGTGGSSGQSAGTRTAASCAASSLQRPQGSVVHEGMPCRGSQHC